MKRIIILAFAAALLISACGKEAPVPQTVTVTLKSNPTTGNSWQVSSLKLLLVAAFIPKIDRSCIYDRDITKRGMIR